MKLDKKVRSGFSLTELLVVIVIIIILAGFTIGALPGIQARINRAKVEAFLEEIQSGLSRYQIEYGNYPLSPEGGVTSDDPSYRDSTGILGAAILYKHLSGDYDEDGIVDEDEVVYVQRLGGKANQDSKDKRVIGVPGADGYMIIDAFNSPIRYLAEKPNKRDKLTMNPDYDLWSIVDTDPTRVTEEGMSDKYITNWTRN